MHFKTYYSRLHTANFPKLISEESDFILENEGYKKLNLNNSLKKV